MGKQGAIHYFSAFDQKAEGTLVLFAAVVRYKTDGDSDHLCDTLNTVHRDQCVRTFDIFVWLVVLILACVLGWSLVAHHLQLQSLQLHRLQQENHLQLYLVHSKAALWH